MRNRLVISKQVLDSQVDYSEPGEPEVAREQGALRRLKLKCLARVHTRYQLDVSFNRAAHGELVNQIRQATFQNADLFKDSLLLLIRLLREQERLEVFELLNAFR